MRLRVLQYSPKMSSSTSRSLSERVFTRKRLSLEQKNREEDFGRGGAADRAQRRLRRQKHVRAQRNGSGSFMRVFCARIFRVRRHEFRRGKVRGGFEKRRRARRIPFAASRRPRAARRRRRCRRRSRRSRTARPRPKIAKTRSRLPRTPRRTRARVAPARRRSSRAARDGVRPRSSASSRREGLGVVSQRQPPRASHALEPARGVRHEPERREFRPVLHVRHDFQYFRDVRFGECRVRDRRERRRARLVFQTHRQSELHAQRQLRRRLLLRGNRAAHRVRRVH